jgi:RNA 3'-terminal phosphate cyclase (ATP)
MITIDGSYGEGGGQILRTSLALATMLNQPVRIENIRAARKKPGLQAQHLTSVFAAARLCDAELRGAAMNSQTLEFIPRAPVHVGDYTFDVMEARGAGSAGATMLIFQTIFLPLARAQKPVFSTIELRGGTHVPFAPPFDYVTRVFLPTLARLGWHARLDIEKWGWYPIGGGVVRAEVQGNSWELVGTLGLTERGALQRITGLAAVSNLPRHIAQRERSAARALLIAHKLDADIDIVEAPATGQGTGIFLFAEYENACAGFSSLGARGIPAERVGEVCARELLAFHATDAAIDAHLADQLILPLAFADGASEFTTARVTQHLLTNAWVVGQFGAARVEIEGVEGQAGRVRIANG